MANYTTVGAVKQALGVTATAQDANVGIAIASASRLIDKHCHRSFSTTGTASARVYAADSEDLCAVDDISTTVGIVVETRGSTSSAWVTVPASDYQLEPLNQLRDGIPWPVTHIRGSFPVAGKDALVRVTGVYGWDEVPAEVEQACLITACRLFKRPESALGVLGVTDMGVLQVSRGLDSDVALLLEDYVRRGF